MTDMTIKDKYREKAHRLDLNKFCWRNINFDSLKAFEENQETMMYI